LAHACSARPAVLKRRLLRQPFPPSDHGWLRVEGPVLAVCQPSMWSLGLLAVEDVVPMADPKAHRVDRVVVASGRVVRELGPICLAVDDSVPVTLAAEAGVDRLG
jgi:hypothetical protein